MNNIISFLLSTILITNLTITRGPSVIEPDFVEESVVVIEKEENTSNETVEGDNFTDRLYNTMPKDGNYMYSPLSVKVALAMAANGAEGKTQSEILDTIGIDDLDEFNNEIKNTIDKYSKTDLLRLDISNSIWVNSDRAGFDFADDYNNTIKEYYNGESGTVTSKNALSTINGWVNDKTEGKIPSILSTPDFDAALINAIYFKAKWKDEFYKADTSPEIFTSRDGTENNIDFMHSTRKLPYAELDGVKVIELSYMTRGSTDGGRSNGVVLDNTDVSMYLLLSEDDSIKEPEKLVSKLKSDGLMSVRKTEISVPKFKIEYSTSLAPTLKTLGIDTAFGSEADFSKMTNNGSGLGISDVIHKTYIEIDEEGTEAAAVTAVIMMGTAMPRPEEIMEFKADKPFTFLIRDNISGETLFIGEYAYAK